MLNVRCSSLPHLFECPGPLNLAEEGGHIEIDEWNDVGPVGSAGHEAMRSVACGRQPDILTLAEKHGVADKADDLAYCVARGTKLWEILRSFFPDVRFEVAIQEEVITGVRLTGTIDVMSLCDDDFGPYVSGLDWKFSFSQRDTYFHQLAGYAVLAMIHFGRRRVVYTIAYPRLGKFSTITFIAGEMDRTADDDHNIETWLTEILIGQIVRNRATYRPGPACQYCRFKGSCPGRSQMVRADVAAFAQPGMNIEDIEAALADSSRRRVVGPAMFSVYEQAKRVKDIADRVITAMHQSVREHGALPIGDDRVLTAKYGSKESISLPIALPVLRTVLTDDQIFAACSIGKGEIEKTIKDTLPAHSRERGKKWMAALDALRSSGAVTTSPTVRYEAVTLNPGDAFDDRSAATGLTDERTEHTPPAAAGGDHENRVGAD